MCLYQTTILNRKYLPNKKNNGRPPPIQDDRTRYVTVDCNKCIECMKNKARNWRVRLSEEVNTNLNGYFVTLTFNTESIIKFHKEIDKQGYDRDNKMVTRAVRLFTERWRKEFKTTIRHWMVTEIGGGRYEHIHIHAILWTDHIEKVEEKWNYGNIWIAPTKKYGHVNQRAINYITKYLHKKDDKHKEYTPIILTSQGIGKTYINSPNTHNNRYIPNKTNITYKTSKGHKLILPTYYKNKLYTDDEKEKIWIEYMDKNEKYIRGIKLNADDDTNIQKVLQHYRAENEQLGFGTKTKNSKIKYEEERIREQKLIQRIKRHENINEKKIREKDEKRQKEIDNIIKQQRAFGGGKKGSRQ